MLELLLLFQVLSCHCQTTTAQNRPLVPKPPKINPNNVNRPRCSFPKLRKFDVTHRMTNWYSDQQVSSSEAARSLRNPRSCDVRLLARRDNDAGCLRLVLHHPPSFEAQALTRHPKPTINRVGCAAPRAPHRSGLGGSKLRFS